jgi:hypothetical protein
MSSVPPNTPPGGGAAPVSSLRSQDPVARLPRTAESRLAGAARCLEGPALRLEGQLRRRLWTARSLHRGPRHPDRRRRGRPAGRHRAHRRRQFLDLVWPLVAAAADRCRPGPAGRVGARPAPQNPCAPRRQLCRHPDPACHPRRWRLRMESHARPWFSSGAIN